MTLYTCSKRLDLSARQAKALKGSIRKWQRIVNGTGENNGADNCPLCKLYVRRLNPQHIKDDCEGCPIMKVTGLWQCRGTPYYECGNAHGLSAIPMLNFLKSILEKAYVRKG